MLWGVRLAVAQDQQASGGDAFGERVATQGGGGQRRETCVQRGDDGFAGVGNSFSFRIRQCSFD